MTYPCPFTRGFLTATTFALGIAITFGGPKARAETSKSNTTSSGDEVIGLPEFTVSAASAVDRFTAGDTTSGSRTNTAIKDLPYSVSSMTSEFMKDFAIVNITDDLSFISAITGNTDSLTFSVRGYTGGNNALVNGHFRYTPLVAGQIERVELIKGPSGSIYGQTNAGGTLLLTTFQPKKVQHEELNLVVGSYDLVSAVAHITGPVPILSAKAPKLFYNVDVTSLHRVFDNPGIARREKSISATLLYKPNENTSVEVISSWQRFLVPVPGDWAIPYLAHTGKNPYSTSSLTYYDGFATWLRHANYASTYDHIERSSTGFSATLQHRFTDWLSFQTGYDWYHTPAETYNVLGSGGTLNSGTGLISAAATPAWATIYGTGWSYSADLLAHYPIGSTDNQTLFTIDDYIGNRRNYTKTAIAGTFTPGFTSFDPLLPLPQSYYAPRDSSHWTSSTTLNNAICSKGFGVNHQTAFFNKRLFLYVGYRHDSVKGYQSVPSAPTAPISGTVYSLSGNARESFIHDSNDAGHAGISVQINKNISWYASVYEGFQPFGSNVPVTVNIPAGSSAFATHQLLKTLSPASTTSLGEETGFKGSFNDQAVVFQASIFNTKQKNVGVSELSDPNNPSSPTVTVNEGDQTSKGFEFDTEFKITKELHAMFNYNYHDAKVENQGVNVLANGHRPRGDPYAALAGAIKYTIRPGWGAQMSARYQGSSPALSPSTGLIKNPTTGLFDATDGRMNIRTPAYAVINVGTSYTWKWGQTKQRINLTVKNLFNRFYEVSGNSTAYAGDGRGVYVSYSINR